MRKALILDLDNTIYPVSHIGEDLFKNLFAQIEQSGSYLGKLQDIKSKIFKQPFQVVAADHNFDEVLKEKCLQLLSELTYNSKINPFKDYEILKTLSCKKFLVTTGFTKLQFSKIKQLNIENDFNEIFVVDPTKSTIGKKDIFMNILTNNKFALEEVLVIGDDIQSEIKAGREIGLETILYDHGGTKSNIKNQTTISNFKEILNYL